MELEPSPENFQPIIDRRPLVPEPLPVRLVAIDDVHLIAAAGAERDLDAFYVGLFGFERDAEATDSIAYHADNFRLCFDILEPPVIRDDLRPLGIEVPILREAEQKLIDARIEYIRQRGLSAGQDELICRDPAGNWLSFMEVRTV